MHIPSKDELLYYAQEGLGQAAGYLLVLSGKIAAKRHDMHAFAHTLAALMAGNTSECYLDLSKCSLFEADELPLTTHDLENVLGNMEDLTIQHWLDEL